MLTLPDGQQAGENAAEPGFRRANLQRRHHTTFYKFFKLFINLLLL